MLSMIVAMGATNQVIGLNGDMPWKLSADLQRFKKITTGGTVIMGRKTWESIPPKFRPLPGRRNIVLSRNPKYEAEGASVFSGMATVLDELSQEEEIFIIGGSSLFAEGMPVVERIYLTLVDYTGPGDTYFPSDPFEKFEPLSGFGEETIMADAKNSCMSTFMVLQRKT